MTDQFFIGQFTVNESVNAPNQLQWTLTTGKHSVYRQIYSTRTVTTDQKDKTKNPRFAFLKISATAHCTHLQSRTSQSASQALQKSAILPTLNGIIIHKNQLGP